MVEAFFKNFECKIITLYTSKKKKKRGGNKTRKKIKAISK